VFVLIDEVESLAAARRVSGSVRAEEGGLVLQECTSPYLVWALATVEGRVSEAAIEAGTQLSN
jgi:hypothetical protein